VTQMPVRRPTRGSGLSRSACDWLSTATKTPIALTIQIRNPGGPGSDEELTFHSYRNATMGSRREAFTAGQRPKKRPMLTDTIKPAIADQRGTAEGKEGTRVRISKLSVYPARIPNIPPAPVRVMASSKNCQVM